MTVQRVALGTHHRDPLGPRTLFQAVQPSLKRRRPGHFLIVRDPVCVGFGLAGTPPQLIAKKDIRDAVICQRRFENVSIELRKMPRKRGCPNVGDRGGASLRQAREELVIGQG